jgi:hypothetical protein
MLLIIGSNLKKGVWECALLKFRLHVKVNILLYAMMCNILDVSEAPVASVFIMWECITLEDHIKEIHVKDTASNSRPVVTSTLRWILRNVGTYLPVYMASHPIISQLPSSHPCQNLTYRLDDTWLPSATVTVQLCASLAELVFICCRYKSRSVTTKCIISWIKRFIGLLDVYFFKVEPLYLNWFWCFLFCRFTYRVCKSRRNAIHVFNHINCLNRVSVRLLYDWITHIDLYSLQKQKGEWTETAVFKISCTVHEPEKILSYTTFRCIYLISKNVPN